MYFQGHTVAHHHCRATKYRFKCLSLVDVYSCLLTVAELNPALPTVRAELEDMKDLKLMERNSLISVL